MTDTQKLNEMLAEMRRLWSRIEPVAGTPVLPKQISVADLEALRAEQPAADDCVGMLISDGSGAIDSVDYCVNQAAMDLPRGTHLLYTRPQPAPSVPEGWKLVPVEPTAEMLDRAMAFALMVSLSADYRWSDYMRDLWARFIDSPELPR